MSDRREYREGQGKQSHLVEAAPGGMFGAGRQLPFDPHRTDFACDGVVAHITCPHLLRPHVSREKCDFMDSGNKTNA